MKKIKAIILAFTIVFAGNYAFAQGMAVLDIANLLQAIEAASQYYQQVQKTIEQVQNTYKQIEQAAQQMATINFDDLQNLGDNFSGLSDNPFEIINATKKSAQDITKSVNNNMNKINRLQDALHAETITVGDMKFSVADLCGAGDPEKNIAGFVKTSWEYTADMAKESIDGYLGNLTYEQKKQIAAKYGMSPRNYANWQVNNYALNSAIKNSTLKGTKEGIKQTLTEIEGDQAVLDALMLNAPDGSFTSQQQVTNSALKLLIKDIGNMWVSIEECAGLVAEKYKAEQADILAKNSVNGAINEYRKNLGNGSAMSEYGAD